MAISSNYNPKNPLGGLAGAVTGVATPGAVNPMHYGGSFTGRKGVLGRSPNKGQHFKVRRRHETIARLENAGFTKPQIAPMIGISVNRLTHIMNSAEYLVVRIAITHGVVVDHAAQLSTIKAQRKEMMAQLLPQGLQAIANVLNSSAHSIADKKLQVAVAQDLFDREGTFAKISRTEVKAVDEFNFETADRASNALINVLRGIAAPPALNGDKSQHTLEAVKANAEFSNSHTLTQIDQQAALNALEDAAASGEFDAEMLKELPANGTVN